MVDIHIARLKQGRIGREHDVRSGDFRFRIAEEQFDAVLPRKRQLRLNVLARAGVFRFLRNDDLILVELLREGECRGKARVACGALSMPSSVASASVM